MEDTLQERNVNSLREQLIHQLNWSGVDETDARRIALVTCLFADEGERLSARFLSSVTGIDRAAVIKAGQALSGVIDIYDEPEKPNFVPPRTKRSKSELRDATISEFGMRCSHCDGMGTELGGPDHRPWCLDRIIPGAAGGEYEMGNVTLSCWECNSRRGALPIEKRVFSTGDWIAMNVEIVMAWAAADLAAWESIQ